MIALFLRSSLSDTDIKEVLHVAFEFRDKLYAILKKSFEKVLANVPFVTDELSIYEFDKSFCPCRARCSCHKLTQSVASLCPGLYAYWALPLLATFGSVRLQQPAFSKVLRK